MPALIPSCFRCGATAPAPPAAAPSVATSIYESHLGLAALTWSRAALGLSLRVDLRLPSASSVCSGASAQIASASFRLRLRPWRFWKRRGSKRYHLDEEPRRCIRTVDFVWDLTRARFPADGGPEPCAGFFVAVAVDGEICLVAGDMEREAYRKTKAKKKGSAASQTLVSRSEHVVVPVTGRTTYKTVVRFGGKEREISIDLGSSAGGGGEREARMCVGVDGERLLQVKRLRWKFRGNEKLEVEGGNRVQVSWDVHNWLFWRQPDRSAAASISVSSHALFVFRFDGPEGEEDTGGFLAQHRRSSAIHGIGLAGGLRNFCRPEDVGNSDRSGSSIGAGRVRVWGGSRRLGGKGRLLKTSSFSSSASSAASTGSGSTVTEWGSAEEGELRGYGFSLLVFLWKR